jgi:pimeloyl-ACP methyl ester carboxylesterase
LWLWIGLGIVVGLPLAVVLFLVGLYFYLIWRFMHHLVRIFGEKPLFIIPRGQPLAGAEALRFPTADGLTLSGCYLRGATTPGRGRRGVILFAPEFGANRWSCLPYCEHLLAHGFDLFAFDFRGQGESDLQPGYEPLQWVTAYEVTDVQAAIAYLKSRSDADPRGVGFFGMSRGGNAGLLAGARDPYLRCFVTDGVFATYSTMVPYMRKWIAIYSQRLWLQAVLPDWYYGLLGRTGLRRIRRERGCRFPHLERAMGRLAPRPLLMVHGGTDTYIKPDMAQALYDLARPPKEFWLVDGAKHNQAIQVAGEEYRQRVLDFFLSHLAEGCQENGAGTKAKPHVVQPPVVAWSPDQAATGKQEG